MTIQTGRLVLRPLRLRDLRTNHAYVSDPETTRYMLFLPNPLWKETLHFLRTVAAELDKRPRRRYEFAVTLGGAHIGSVSVCLSEDRQSGDFGWIIRREHWGKGYATEAARALMEFIRTLGVTKLTACCDARNAASVRVLEKLGLKLESEGVRLYPGSGESAREFKYSMHL